MRKMVVPLRMRVSPLRAKLRNKDEKKDVLVVKLSTVSQILFFIR
jgi:hypothetical protein